MNRVERTAQIARLEALADAAKAAAGRHRAELEESARVELAEQGTAPTWRLPGIGTVGLSVSREAAVVADAGAWTSWVAGRHPDEIVQQVRPTSERALLGRLVVDGDVVVDPGTGEIVPGLSVRPGGMPGRLTVRLTPDAKAAALAGAEADLEGMALLASETSGHLAPAEVDG
jgi:hypothetical protein